MKIVTTALGDEYIQERNEREKAGLDIYEHSLLWNEETNKSCGLRNPCPGYGRNGRTGHRPGLGHYGGSSFSPDHAEWDTPSIGVEFVEKTPTALGVASKQFGFVSPWFVVRTSFRKALGWRTQTLVFRRPNVKAWGQEETEMETCFSIPDKSFPVERHTKCRVEYLDETGKECVFTVKNDPHLARIILHEYDHIRGWMIDQSTCSPNGGQH